MGLYDIVIPDVEAVLIEAVTDGRLVSRLTNPPRDVPVGAIRFGEQFQVAQPPEIWILNATAGFPERQGSELEQSDWVLTLKLLYPHANDSANAEAVLSALIEPIRQCFRLHLKLLHPTMVARARVLNANWYWTVVNEIIYRAVDLKLAVREKVPAQWNP